MSVPLRTEGSYIPSLDGLRAVAVLMVIGRHTIGPIFNGEFGVTLFFFISGFIITRQCLERPFGGTDVLPFYVKRFFRLAPAVFVYIAVASLLVGLLGGRIPLADIRATLLYYANYHAFSHTVTPRTGLPPLEMTWSLAVEEHFYVAFPLLLVVAKTPGRLARALVLVIVATFCWRAWKMTHGSWEWLITTHTDTRLDSIAYGCLLSTLIALAPGRPGLQRAMSVAGRAPVAALAVLVIIGSIFLDGWKVRAFFIYPLQGAALTSIFCFLFVARPSAADVVDAFLSSRFMTWTGRLSYSLYLFHILGLFLVLDLGIDGPAKVIGCVAFGYVSAMACQRWVETPGRRFGKRAAEALRHRLKVRMSLT